MYLDFACRDEPDQEHSAGKIENAALLRTREAARMQHPRRPAAMIIRLNLISGPAGPEQIQTLFSTLGNAA